MTWPVMKKHAEDHRVSGGAAEGIARSGAYGATSEVKIIGWE